MLRQHEGGHVLEHRNFDGLSFSGPLAVVESNENALRGNDPDHVIGKYHGHEARLAQRPRVAGGDPGHALDDGVVGGAPMIRPIRAKALEVAHNQLLVARPQRRCRKSETLQCCRPDICNKHIGGAQQTIERRARLLLLEVERQRALVAVEMSELAGELAALRAPADGAQQVAGRRFDLDDFRAVVTEIECRGRTDDNAREINDADARERTAAHGRRPSRTFTWYARTPSGPHAHRSAAVSPDTRPLNVMLWPTNSGCCARAS